MGNSIEYPQKDEQTKTRGHVDPVTKHQHENISKQTIDAGEAKPLPAMNQKGQFK